LWIRVGSYSGHSDLLGDYDRVNFLTYYVIFLTLESIFATIHFMEITDKNSDSDSQNQEPLALETNQDDLKRALISEGLSTENASIEKRSLGEESNIYELGYLLLPTIALENVSNEVDTLKEALKDLEAHFISDERPKLITLAYEMDKMIDNKRQRFTNAYFGWIKFELERGSLSKFKEALEQNKNILRFLIIKTVRENTLASRRVYVPRRKVLLKKTKEEPKGEINKEEVDKKIEELVVE